MIGHLLSQTASWKPRTGTDGYGRPVFGAEVTIPCRWEWKRRMVRSTAGQEVVSEAKVFAQAAVNAGDQFVTPQGQTVTVITIGIQYDHSGREIYREVYV